MAAHSIPAVGRALRPAWVGYESVVARRNGQRVAHMIHVGKTGGIAVRNAFAHARNSSTHRVRFWGHTFRLWDVPARDQFFFFLRDPVDRFVSAFAYRANQGTPLFPDPWTKEEQRAFERFSIPEELGRALFEDPLADAAMGEIEHVRDSFLDWFRDEDYFLSRIDGLLLVGRQETLAEDVERLSRLVGVTATPPTGDVEANRTSSTIDRTLSPLAREKLTTWYASDYRFLDVLEEVGVLSR